MNPAQLSGAVLEGLWLALRLLLPLMLVAALSAAAAGALARFLGLADTMASRIIKSLCVIAALALGIGWLGDASARFARSSWTTMAQVDGDPGKR